MGLLKDLFNIAGKVASVAQEIAAKQESTAKKPTAGNPTPSVPPVRSAETVREKSVEEWRAYFREIIRSACALYEVREDVPVTDLVGNVSDEFQLYATRPRQVYKAEWGKPYTFVLYQGGVPKGVVMLGDGHSHYANVKYLIARMYAKKIGIPYINFYTQMPNERDYVVGRIRRFLG